MPYDYTDIGLNRLTNDLDVQNGDLFLSTYAEQIRQHWLIRIRTWLGEWFLDINQGTPYIQEIFVKGTRAPRIVSIITEITLATPGVLQVLDVRVIEVSPQTRKIKIEAEAIIEGPENIRLETEESVDTLSGNELNYLKGFGDLKIWFSPRYATLSDYPYLPNLAGQGQLNGYSGIIEPPELNSNAWLVGNPTKSLYYNNPDIRSVEKIAHISGTPLINVNGKGWTIIVVSGKKYEVPVNYLRLRTPLVTFQTTEYNGTRGGLVLWEEKRRFGIAYFENWLTMNLGRWTSVSNFIPGNYVDYGNYSCYDQTWDTNPYQNFAKAITLDATKLGLPGFLSAYNMGYNNWFSLPNSSGSDYLISNVFNSRGSLGLMFEEPLIIRDKTFYGFMGDVLVYNGCMSAQKIKQISTHLGNKWKMNMYIGGLMEE